jgi:hypothetical protein
VSQSAETIKLKEMKPVTMETLTLMMDAALHALLRMAILVLLENLLSALPSVKMERKNLKKDAMITEHLLILGAKDV